MKSLRHIKTKRNIDLIVQTNASLEDITVIVGGNYGSLFVSNKSKRDAWKQYKIYCHDIGRPFVAYGFDNEETYLESFIDFLDLPPNADFIKFLAKKRNMDEKQYFLSLVSP